MWNAIMFKSVLERIGRDLPFGSNEASISIDNFVPPNNLSVIGLWSLYSCYHRWVNILNAHSCTYVPFIRCQYRIARLLSTTLNLNERPVSYSRLVLCLGSLALHVVLIWPIMIKGTYFVRSDAFQMFQSVISNDERISSSERNVHTGHNLLILQNANNANNVVI